MEEDSEELNDDYHEEEETDEDYEFEASNYFDFTRPELDYEIQEAERWFEVSGDYGPAPFIVKLNLEKLFAMDTSHENGSSGSDIKSRHDPDYTPEVDDKGKSHDVVNDAAKVKTSSPAKVSEPRASTLMKPTASHLAKQKKLQDMQSRFICTRIHRVASPNWNSSPSPTPNLATKRQKLESGYLGKAAQLKHHTPFLHKSPKKVTIPKEPELETMLRAQRRSSKNSSASSESAKKGCIFKAHPLNRKILLTPVTPRSRICTPQFPECQVSNANSSASCVSNSATNSERSYSGGVLKHDKQEALFNSKACFLKEKESKSTGNNFLGVLPLEQFSQLSLGSDMERHVSNKESKENDSSSFHSKVRTSRVKPRGHLKVGETRCWPNMMTRSVDIR